MYVKYIIVMYNEQGIWKQISYKQTITQKMLSKESEHN